MKFIIKNPDAWTLYKEVQDPATWPISEPLPGSQIHAMTDAELVAWEAEMKLSDKSSGRIGWRSAPITPLQIRRALNQMGRRAAMETAVAASNQNLKDAWEYSAAITRDGPLMTLLENQLGLSDTQLDTLFSLASTFAD